MALFRPSRLDPGSSASISWCRTEQFLGSHGSVLIVALQIRTWMRDPPPPLTLLHWPLLVSCRKLWLLSVSITKLSICLSKRTSSSFHFNLHHQTVL